MKVEFEELIFADAPIEVSGFTLDEIDHIVLGEVDEAIEEGPLRPRLAQLLSPGVVTSLTSGLTGSSAAAQLILRHCSGS